MDGKHSAWERIFAEEYDVSLESAGDQIDQWLDEFATQDSFEEFYEETVENSDEAKFVPGKNRAYSVRNAAEGGQLNCEGKSFVTALAGMERYGKEFELLVDYQVDDRMGMPENILSHHVTARDAEGTVYGSRQEGLNSFDRLSGDDFAALYFVSEAKTAEQNGELDEAERLRNEAQDLRNGSSYIGRRLHENTQSVRGRRGRV